MLLAAEALSIECTTQQEKYLATHMGIMNYGSSPLYSTIELRTQALRGQFAVRSLSYLFLHDVLKHYLLINYNSHDIERLLYCESSLLLLH